MKTTNNQSTKIRALKKIIQSQGDDIKKINLNKDALYQIVLKMMGDDFDAVLIMDDQHRMMAINDAGLQFFESNRDEIIGQSIEWAIPPSDLVGCELIKKLSIKKNHQSYCLTDVSISQIEDQNQSCYVVHFCGSHQKCRLEAADTFLSSHDYLTKLFKREYFEKQVDVALQRARYENSQLALMCVNLDDFTWINDTLGHAVGDFLLREVANSLRESVSQGDFIARLDGDEFSLILTNINTPMEAEQAAHRIMESLSKISLPDGQLIDIHASIGIVIYPISGTSASDLIKFSNLAMCAIKAEGKSNYRFFSEPLNQQKQEYLSITGSLKKVIGDDQLAVYYQPIVDVNTRLCVSMEVLLRWKNPHSGFILPSNFITYAEKIGVMSSISRWMIAHVAANYKKLNFELLDYISMNFSVKELNTPGVIESIFESMKRYNLPVEKMVLELTEVTSINEFTTAIEKIRALAKAGIRLAIDDYGVGYSSLSLLRQLPISFLKMDKTFIEDLPMNLVNVAIVKSTIVLAHQLGIKVIAEGVEKEDQLIFLKENGCDYIQGYYFSKPVSLDQLQTIIHSSDALGPKTY
jgi:diguanylate cyclase (GGDEF)-like protein